MTSRDAARRRFVAGAIVGETFARQLEQVASGTPPGEIPIERPLLFPITINLGTAAALGVTFPPAFLKRADHVLR